MLEKEDQPLEMGGFELAVDAVKRVRDGMGDRRFLEVTLKIENVLAQSGDLSVLGFRRFPRRADEFCTDPAENKS